MINPSKVIGFLDVFGAWDATLVFVLARSGSYKYYFFLFHL